MSKNAFKKVIEQKKTYQNIDHLNKIKSEKTNSALIYLKKTFHLNFSQHNFNKVIINNKYFLSIQNRFNI